MTDKQKAFDEIVNLASNYSPSVYYDEIQSKAKTIRAALEAKAVDVELLEALKEVLYVTENCHDCWRLTSTDERIKEVNDLIARAEAGRGK